MFCHEFLSFNTFQKKNLLIIFFNSFFSSRPNPVFTVMSNPNGYIKADVRHDKMSSLLAGRSANWDNTGKTSPLGTSGDSSGNPYTLRIVRANRVFKPKVESQSVLEFDVGSCGEDTDIVLSRCLLLPSNAVGGQVTCPEGTPENAGWKQMKIVNPTIGRKLLTKSLSSPTLMTVTADTNVTLVGVSGVDYNSNTPLTLHFVPPKQRNSETCNNADTCNNEAHNQTLRSVTSKVEDTFLHISTKSVIGKAGYNLAFSDQTNVTRLLVYGHKSKDTFMTVHANPNGRHTILQDLSGDGTFIFRDTTQLFGFLSCEGGSGRDGAEAHLKVVDDKFHATFSLNGFVHLDKSGNHTVVLNNVQQRTYRVKTMQGMTATTTLTKAQHDVNHLLIIDGVEGAKTEHLFSGSERGAETKYQFHSDGEHVLKIGNLHRLDGYAGSLHIEGEDPDVNPKQKLKVIVHASQDQRAMKVKVRRNELSILDANDDQTIFRIYHVHVDTLEVHFGVGGVEGDIDHGDHGGHRTEYLLYFNEPTNDAINKQRGKIPQSEQRTFTSVSARPPTLKNVVHVQRYTAPTSIFGAHEVHVGLLPVGARTLESNDCTKNGINCIEHPLKGAKSMLAIAGSVEKNAGRIVKTNITFMSGSSQQAPAQHFHLNDGCVNQANMDNINPDYQLKGNVVATQDQNLSPKPTSTFCNALSAMSGDLFPNDVCERQSCAVAYGGNTTHLHFVTGGENDLFFGKNVKAKTVNIHTHEGNDVLYLENFVNVGGGVVITTGDGSDEITFVYPMPETTLDTGINEKDYDAFRMITGEHYLTDVGTRQMCGVSEVSRNNNNDCVKLMHKPKRHDKFYVVRNANFNYKYSSNKLETTPLSILPPVTGYSTTPPIFNDVSTSTNQVLPSYIENVYGKKEYKYYVKECGGKPFIRVDALGAGNHTVHMNAMVALNCGIRVTGDRMKNQTLNLIVNTSSFENHLTFHSDRHALHAIHTAAGRR